MIHLRGPSNCKCFSRAFKGLKWLTTWQEYEAEEREFYQEKPTSIENKPNEKKRQMVIKRTSEALIEGNMI